MTEVFQTFDFFFLLSSIALALGYAIQYGVKGKNLLPSALGGTLSWIILTALELHSGNAILASFVAAAFVSVWANIFSRLAKAPSTIFLIVGVLPLVPGRFIYLTMSSLVEGHLEESLRLGFETVGISLAITIAILLVTSTFSLFSFLRTKRFRHGQS